MNAAQKWSDARTMPVFGDQVTIDGSLGKVVRVQPNMNGQVIIHLEFGKATRTMPLERFHEKCEVKA